MAVIGCLSAGVTLRVFAYAWWTHGSLTHARNAAFAVLVMEALLRALSARSIVKAIWQVGLFSNLRLLVVVASCTMQLAILYLPALQTLFGTAAISLRQYAAWLALEAVPLMVLERLNRISCREGAGLAVVLAVAPVGGVAAQ